MFINPALYSLVFKFSYFLAGIPAMLVIISAAMSVKQMGGTLGEGLKKIATGSVIHTIMILTYLFIERGSKGLLSDTGIQAFFMLAGLTGATFLITGYLQIYKVAKKLKLFTV